VVALQDAAQLGQHRLQLLLVGRVEGDELAAGAPVGVLDVGQQQHLPAEQELERDTPRAAVVPHLLQDLGGLFQAGGDVDLPALRRQLGAVRMVDHPVLRLRPGPSGRNGTSRKLEVELLAADLGRGVVEVRIGQAVHLVPLVHPAPP